MSGPELNADPNDAETGQELRQLLNRMLVQRINAQQIEAIEASKADPSALLRYRELQLRKQALETSTRPG